MSLVVLTVQAAHVLFRQCCGRRTRAGTQVQGRGAVVMDVGGASGEKFVVSERSGFFFGFDALHASVGFRFWSWKSAGISDGAATVGTASGRLCGGNVIGDRAMAIVTRFPGSAASVEARFSLTLEGPLDEHIL